MLWLNYLAILTLFLLYVIVHYSSIGSQGRLSETLLKAQDSPERRVCLSCAGSLYVLCGRPLFLLFCWLLFHLLWVSVSPPSFDACATFNGSAFYRIQALQCRSHRDELDERRLRPWKFRPMHLHPGRLLARLPVSSSTPQPWQDFFSFASVDYGNVINLLYKLASVESYLWCLLWQWTALRCLLHCLRSPQKRRSTGPMHYLCIRNHGFYWVRLLWLLISCSHIDIAFLQVLQIILSCVWLWICASSSSSGSPLQNSRSIMYWAPSSLERSFQSSLRQKGRSGRSRRILILLIYC